MKLVILVVLIITLSSTSATLEKLLKQDVESDVGIPPLFPKNFWYPSITAVGKDANWSGYAKFDGANNIISVNGTGYNATAKITSVVTAISDFANNLIYNYTAITGQCSKQANPYPIPVNIIDALNGALVLYTKKVSEEKKDGKTYTTYKVSYDVLNGYIVYADKDLVYVNGTAMGQTVSANIGAPMQTKTFSRGELYKCSHYFYIKFIILKSWYKNNEVIYYFKCWNFKEST